ncbi:unnamed protein product, partial [Mesorhabditis spiculigera]
MLNVIQRGTTVNPEEKKTARREKRNDQGRKSIKDKDDDNPTRVLIVAAPAMLVPMQLIPISFKRTTKVCALNPDLIAQLIDVRPWAVSWVLAPPLTVRTHYILPNTGLDGDENQTCQLCRKEAATRPMGPFFLIGTACLNRINYQRGKPAWTRRHRNDCSHKNFQAESLPTNPAERREKILALTEGNCGFCIFIAASLLQVPLDLYS